MRNICNIVVLQQCFDFCLCFARESRNLWTKMSAFEEKKHFVKNKKLNSDLSPKIPQDQHTYSERPWLTKCPGNIKVFQAGPDQMLLKKKKSTFTTVFCRPLEKKNYLASEIFILFKIGWEFLQMDWKFKCRRVWRI